VDEEDELESDEDELIDELTLEILLLDTLEVELFEL
jgi:hypothetical protein